MDACLRTSVPGKGASAPKPVESFGLGRIYHRCHTHSSLNRFGDFGCQNGPKMRETASADSCGWLSSPDAVTSVIAPRDSVTSVQGFHCRQQRMNKPSSSGEDRSIRGRRMRKPMSSDNGSQIRLTDEQTNAFGQWWKHSSPTVGETIVFGRRWIRQSNRQMTIHMSSDRCGSTCQRQTGKPSSSDKGGNDCQLQTANPTPSGIGRSVCNRLTEKPFPSGNDLSSHHRRSERLMSIWPHP